MSQQATIRRPNKPWGHSAFGLFVAVWLNLALAPCAMALEIEDDHDCPHCPPAQTHDHGSMHDGMAHDAPCVDGLSDCALAEDLSFDARNGQLKLKDAPLDLPVAIAPRELDDPIVHADTFPLKPRYASVHAGAPPPLHVLYCVYLD